MKFITEIQNVDTTEKYSNTFEGKDVQNTHKHILMKVLENNEEVISMTDESGNVVYHKDSGFITVASVV